MGIFGYKKRKMQYKRKGKRTYKYGPKRRTNRFRRSRRSRYSAIRRYRKSLQHKVNHVFYKTKIEQFTPNATTKIHQGVLYGDMHLIKGLLPSDTQLDNYAMLYDKFMLKSVTWSFWIEDNAMFIDDTKDNIPCLYTTYDPDAKGRQFAEFGDFLLCPNTRTQIFKPYTVAKFKLFPRYGHNNWGTKVPSVSSSILQITNTKPSWFDMEDIKVQMQSMNGIQYMFRNLVQPVTYQLSVHLCFKGIRNGQTYK